MFAESLRSDRSPLTSYYGAVAGLSDLGPEVIKVLIIPHIKSISARLDQTSDGVNLAGTTNTEKITTNIRDLIVKSVTPVLKALRPPPDNVEEYKSEFGSIGPYLFKSVVRSRGAT